FRIVAPFTGGRFDPSPYPPRTMRNGAPNVWPAFDGIDGEFHLHNNKLRFDLARGHYRNFVLHNVTGRIDDTGTPKTDLVIAGTGQGPLADLIDYANRSSLGYMSRHVGEKLSAQGPASLALKLSIPRHPHPLIRVEGALGFQNNRLTYENAPPLTNVSGRVSFTSHSVSADRLTAHVLGGDVRASGALRPDGRYAFDLNGDIAADAARNLGLHGPAAALLDRVKGHAPYALNVRGARGALPEVDASSDLSGLALDLPAPFGKQAGEPMPFDFSLRPNAEAGAGVQQAALTLGPFAANYLLQPKPGQQMPEVLRGAIGLNRPADLPTDGVTAAVDLPAFDADAWRHVVQQLRPARALPNAGTEANSVAPATTALSPWLPSRAALHVGTLTLLKRHWENVVVGASRNGNDWQANVASNQVSGHLSWQPGAVPGTPGTLEARLARLVVPAADENDLLGQAISQPVQNMPAVDLVVNQLIVHDHDLGRLQVNAHNLEEDGVPVWRLDMLELSNPAARLTATASWRAVDESGSEPDGAVHDQPTPRHTAVNFRLDVKDAGALLQRAGIEHMLKGGEGVLYGDADWRGGP
ncbi:MAG TPA: DUF3971 domain-containing protein, partial [Paraburkholderia sp.]